LIKILIVNFYYDLIMPNTDRAGVCIGVSGTVTDREFLCFSFGFPELARFET